MKITPLFNLSCAITGNSIYYDIEYNRKRKRKRAKNSECIANMNDFRLNILYCDNYLVQLGIYTTYDALSHMKLSNDIDKNIAEKKQAMG